MENNSAWRWFVWIGYGISQYMKLYIKDRNLERAVDGALSHIPTVKVFTPSTPSPTPGA